MHAHLTHSQAPRPIVIDPSHDDMHPGHGVVAMPAHDVIARRAYYIYVESGCIQGQCKQNWHRAENDLQSADRDLYIDTTLVA